MSQTETYQQLFQRVCERKGGPAAVEALLSQPLDNEQLANTSDDRFLAAFTKKVFQSGFVWRVVEQKWPDFEEVFFNFDIEKVLLMPDEMLERKAQNPAIIRNFNKVKTIRDNALMIEQTAKEYGSFGRFIGQWPERDITGLWLYLKQHGARLGGNTGPYALRAIGKDTFILSRDVEQYFVKRQIISGSATSKRSLKQIQEYFNQLQQQSGRSLQELSRLIAYSVGDNFVQLEEQ